jgi:hypothetical protein
MTFIILKLKFVQVRTGLNCLWIRFSGFFYNDCRGHSKVLDVNKIIGVFIHTARVTNVSGLLLLDAPHYVEEEGNGSLEKLKSKELLRDIPFPLFFVLSLLQSIRSFLLPSIPD